MVIAYKIYINRAYNRHFKYFKPTDEEIRCAYVHSEGADNTGHRLERRFGHPALHMELFTPMLHSKMMPLLSEVYKGRLNYEKATLNEYGGQKLDAQLVSGGIKIAAVDQVNNDACLRRMYVMLIIVCQRDLDYDPVLYQRDRGELDWDSRSMLSMGMFTGDNQSSVFKTSAPHLRSGSPGPPGYDQYLSSGPGTDIELTALDSTAHLHQPLLNTQIHYSQRPQRSPSPTSDYYRSPSPSMPPYSHRTTSEGSREAPIHRPYPPSRQVSSYEMLGYDQNNTNSGYLMGPGAHRGQ
jgi:calcium permeable stress-gated cation channel